jgi:hypothetical protein
MIFMGYYYYPSGGMNDFAGDAETLKEIYEIINVYKNDDDMEWDWLQIYDNKNKEFIQIE